MPSSSRGGLQIEIALEAREQQPDIFRPAQIGAGVGDGVLILEPQQGRELLLVQLPNARRNAGWSIAQLEGMVVLCARLLMRVELTNTLFSVPLGFGR